MTKILKKVQLSAEQSTPMSADPTKGTQTNPYTQVEMAQLQEAGAWNGGYVEGMGYIVPMMSMNSGSSSSGDSDNMDEYEGIHVNNNHDDTSHGMEDIYDWIENMFELPQNRSYRVKWTDGYTGTKDVNHIGYWEKSKITVESLSSSSIALKANTNYGVVDLKLTLTQKIPPATQLEPDCKWKKLSKNNYNISGTIIYDWIITDSNNNALHLIGGIYYSGNTPLVYGSNSVIISDSGTYNHHFIFDHIDFHQQS